MIKLAIVTRSEEHLQEITNRLDGAKDINLVSTIIIKNPKIEDDQNVAAEKQMIELQPDICIMEQAVLRDSAAVDLKKMLDYRNIFPKMKTIIIGIRFNEENVIAMIQGGIRGFFRFALSDDQLIKCIRMVASGDIWLEAELITPVIDEFVKEFMKRRDLLQPLTNLSSEKLKILSPREMDILELISHSMTNEEIAEKLFISSKTVKTHVRNIFQKAGIRNRVEAALLYARHTL
jgi:two-component system, NarL family, response regulator DegU